MSAAAPPIAMRSGTQPLLPPRTIAINPLPPVLLTRDETTPPPGPPRRTKLWEFNTNLHCSIIGTCLSAGDLRQVMKKLELAPRDSTDHELHGTAVTLAGRHDAAGKLLHKALDKRHHLAINQFAKADTADRVRALWRDAVRRGDIPGAYWATLTHPAATPALVREAFGDVHMLSHLVGAANRADIRRLCQLEADKAELEAKLERQQLALRDAVVTRDQCIQELRQALARKIADEPPSGANRTGDGCPGNGLIDDGRTGANRTGDGRVGDGRSGDGRIDDGRIGDAAEDPMVLRQLVADLERRLAGETRRRAASNERLSAAQAAVAQERSARAKAKQERDALRQELDAIEASLAADSNDAAPGTLPDRRLDGVVLLYVGGRAHQVAHLRAVGEQFGATFLHHDGGIENHPNLLPGLTSRADLVLFPVECISHDAAHAVKLLCRQAGKRFIPLRSAGATSLLAALRRPALSGLADAAD
jgi:hypothetical protein